MAKDELKKQAEQRFAEARRLLDEAKKLEDEWKQHLYEKQAKLNQELGELEAKSQLVKNDLEEVEVEIATYEAGGEYISSKRIVSITEVKGHTTDEEILEFLDIRPNGATTGEIQKEYKWASDTVTRRMKALLEAKLVAVERKGNAKVWKAA